MSTEQIKPKASILATGLALFSMFFGAGNIVFPLIIGRSAGSEALSAIGGLGLSAVLFPFLGLIAMMLYQGNLKDFLARLGKWPAFALMFVLYMSQGPVGSMPRLITLMYASVQPYFPSLPLSLFSLIICAAVLAMTFRPRRIIRLLGVVLTPILLLALGVLVSFGIENAPQPLTSAHSSGYQFLQGLKGGYQTLDLTAALLFATMIMPHLSRGIDPVNNQGELRRRMTYASIIAASLLMASYIGLCYLSAHHSAQIGAEVAPVDLLHAISIKILGPVGGLVAALAVFMACLTTAISLAAVFSDYLHTEFFQQKVSRNQSLLITLGITAAMANLGFTAIANILGPILEILYPGLILLCLYNIAHWLYRSKLAKAAVN